MTAIGSADGQHAEQRHRFRGGLTRGPRHAGGIHERDGDPRPLLSHLEVEYLARRQTQQVAPRGADGEIELRRLARLQDGRLVIEGKRRGARRPGGARQEAHCGNRRSAQSARSLLSSEGDGDVHDPADADYSNPATSARARNLAPGGAPRRGDQVNLAR
jgi:hypothetical protein